MRSLVNRHSPVCENYTLPTYKMSINFANMRGMEATNVLLG